MSTVQKALVKHRNALLAPTVVHTDFVSADVVLTALIEIKNLGYTLDSTLIEATLKTNRSFFVKWAKDVIQVLRELKGAHYKYTPMYPNFPKQVATAHAQELFVNAMIHYIGDWFGMRFLPNYDVENRPALIVDETTYDVLTVADITVLETIFVNLITSKIALNKPLTEDLLAVAEHLTVIPTVTNIPNKENFATYLALFDFKVDRAQVTSLISSVNNPLDVLRIIAGKGGSDPSLAGKIVFTPAPRWLRKTIMSTLDKFTNESLAESFRARPKLWKQFFTHIHAGDYPQFTVAQEAIQKLRSGELRNDFNSALEKALTEKDLDTVLKLVNSRPTIFVRRLREIATIFPEGWQVSFINQGKKASLTSLLQALARFETENNNYVVTTIGRKGKTGVYANPTKWLEEDEKKTIADLLRVTIKNKLRELPSLGNVHYLPVKGHQTIPFGLRSAADSNRLLGKGSRVPFNLKGTLRFFIHWKDLPFDRVDIDLSAALLDENFRSLGELSFYNLRNFAGQHSGDITSAPEGASEFIDISVPVVKDKNPNVRYIAMSGIVYTGQPFDTIPEVMAGFMEREGNPQAGEIFDARTVKNAFTITNPSRSVIPLVFDLHTGEAIWVDINSHVAQAAFTARHIGGSKNVLAHVVQKRYISIDELLSFHIEARSQEIVETAEEADTVIDVSKITFDEILSEWL